MEDLTVGSTASAGVEAETPLDEAGLGPDPISAFNRWLQAAWDAGERQANGMALATASASAAPAVRFVLLHRAGPAGFMFFTNYESAKAGDLAANAQAALAFWWPRLHRQVRVIGTTARARRAESREYWESRPYGSRIAALASRQSRRLDSRASLEAEVARLSRLHPDEPPLPDNWGGYVLAPSSIEFWQGRTNRLHDRIRYLRVGPVWGIERLAP